MSGRTVWLSRDPIAENGGINLYAYVDNSPIIGYDPLGLTNYSKLIVGGTNTGRGTAKIAQGAGEISAGITIVGAGIGTGTVTPTSLSAEVGGVALILDGLRNVIGGEFLIKRGFQQGCEAIDDPDPWNWRNFLGLAPFGQHYDDPHEDWEHFKEQYEDMSFFERVGEIFTF